jgi:receptor-type tyrosine-protein phosphatase eta
MLTKCVEDNRTKCEQYWPTNMHEEVIYGDIHVTLTNAASSVDWHTREIHISLVRFH